jgi:hypothetical protein
MRAVAHKDIRFEFEPGLRSKPLTYGTVNFVVTVVGDATPQEIQKISGAVSAVKQTTFFFFFTPQIAILYSPSTFQEAEAYVIRRWMVWQMASKYTKRMLPQRDCSLICEPMDNCFRDMGQLHTRMEEFQRPDKEGKIAFDLNCLTPEIWFGIMTEGFGFPTHETCMRPLHCTFDEDDVPPENFGDVQLGVKEKQGSSLSAGAHSETWGEFEEEGTMREVEEVEQAPEDVRVRKNKNRPIMRESEEAEAASPVGRGGEPTPFKGTSSTHRSEERPTSKKAAAAGRQVGEEDGDSAGGRAKPKRSGPTPREDGANSSGAAPVTPSYVTPSQRNQLPKAVPVQGGDGGFWPASPAQVDPRHRGGSVAPEWVKDVDDTEAGGSSSGQVGFDGSFIFDRNDDDPNAPSWQPNVGDGRWAAQNQRYEQDLHAFQAAGGGFGPSWQGNVDHLHGGSSSSAAVRDSSAYEAGGGGFAPSWQDNVGHLHGGSSSAGGDDHLEQGRSSATESGEAMFETSIEHAGFGSGTPSAHDAWAAQEHWDHMALIGTPRDDVRSADDEAFARDFGLW